MSATRASDEDIMMALGDSVAMSLGLIAGCGRTVADAIDLMHRTVDVVADGVDVAAAHVQLARCGCVRREARLGRHTSSGCPDGDPVGRAHALAAVFGGQP